jgi:hypothetical protein
MAQPKKAAPDWERIEADYRAGVLSIREIAASQGITDTAIRKRAKKDEWVRDLAERIQAKAEALVRTAEVRTQVRTESAIPERELVEANAEAIARIRMAHRGDISRSRALAMSLLGELESQTADPELFDKLGELVIDTGTEAESKLLDAYRRVLSTPGRIDGMKKLAETLKNLIALEREAYGLVEAQKIEMTTRADNQRKPQDMTDDELLAIATGGGAGTANPA